MPKQMPIAAQIKQILESRAYSAFTFECGYAIDVNRGTVHFARSVKNKVVKRGATGRVTHSIHEYADGSCIVYKYVNETPKITVKEPPMKKNTGFTLIELMTVLAVMAILGVIVANILLNNSGATQKRAKQQAITYASEYGIQYKRLDCLPDSDSDGYSTCTMTTDEKERIFLQCISGFWSGVWGADGCTEVDTVMRLNQRTSRK